MSSERILCRAASFAAAAVMAAAALGVSAAVKDKNVYVGEQSGTPSADVMTSTADVEDGGTNVTTAGTTEPDIMTAVTESHVTSAEPAETTEVVVTDAPQTDGVTVGGAMGELGFDPPPIGTEPETSTVVIPPETEPPVTEPPATEPPTTDVPPVTEPPATETPPTEPPATEVPPTEPPVTGPATDVPPTGEPSTGEPVTTGPVTSPTDETDPGGEETDPVTPEPPEGGGDENIPPEA